MSAPTTSSPLGESPPFPAWKIAFVWMVPAVLSTLETVMFASQSGHPIAVWRAFVGEAPQWFGWAALTPVIVALSERFPLHRPLHLRSVLVHASASLGAGLLLALADALVNAWVRPSPSSLLRVTRNWFLGGLPATTFVYFAIVTASYAWQTCVRLHESDRQAAALAVELRDAQLGALRMQLQPHFLFNSLNAVMALVRDRDTGGAVRALALLSDLLRAAINTGDAHEATLASEIAFVTRYLDLAKLRFGDRLSVVIDVPDELDNAMVPVLILQPFVENSLKHGVLRGREGNTILITAAAGASGLALEVRDDGCGITSAATSRGGLGISNTRRRLERMYGAGAGLTVRNTPSAAGVEVKITMPLKREATPPGAPSRLLTEAVG